MKIHENTIFSFQIRLFISDLLLAYLHFPVQAEIPVVENWIQSAYVQIDVFSCCDVQNLQM